MLPLMLLTRRQGPQTLLLTALALLIAAATIMLACGPAAQPIPEEGNTFTAAPPVEGGSEEPEEEPTATPTPAPTDTPTPEPNIGTDDLDTGEGTQNSGNVGPIDWPPPPPAPTLKYPNLEHNLDKLAIESDNAGGGVGGQSDTTIEVVIWTSTNPDATVTKALVEWLKSRGISSSLYGRNEGFGDGSFVQCFLPTRLLGAVSTQEGVIKVEDASYQRPRPTIVTP